MRFHALWVHLWPQASIVASTSLHIPTQNSIPQRSNFKIPNTYTQNRGQIVEPLTYVLREESGERAYFKHAAFVPGRIELLNLPVVNARIIPRLWFVVLPLVFLLSILQLFRLLLLLPAIDVVLILRHPYRAPEISFDFQILDYTSPRGTRVRERLKFGSDRDCN